MKSYIFSDHERTALKGFLAGKVPRDTMAVMQVKSRMKTFTLLKLDVDLYLALAKVFAET